ncbi:universal stress protein [Actinomadura rupiterrae]|uniref:universal stress protein n=1 Tax=Actinomadura rupiterrae TaxID=559627 RepID=UPI0020A31171|nr:universal stress protein [Actinomadura rupiterrae]MCP2338927.1 nucleotide-binding universal stress UspA family protein [Actinomadura rupiterrae]
MDAGGHLLVGFDGTFESDRALRWAVREAILRRLPLTLCHAWRWPYPATYIDDGAAAIIRRMGDHLLDHGVRRAQELGPGLVVRKRLMSGPAYSALLGLSGDAALVVVGSHPPDEVPPGSTALRVPAKSKRPTVVVRAAHIRHRRVVAGFDGSAAGIAALGLAFGEAALWGSRLRVVQGCWEPGGAENNDLALYADEDKLRRVFGEQLESAVAPWRDQYPWVQVETALLLEPPRQALFEAADSADLLVVGDRGLGGTRPDGPGVIAAAVLQHAPCTVMVVPAT